jgi:hypothetical protein
MAKARGTITPEAAPTNNRTAISMGDPAAKVLKTLPKAMTSKASQMALFQASRCARKAIAIVVAANAVISHEST